MEEPVIDGDDYASHRQLVPVDDVTPISHSISPSSSPIAHNHGSALQNLSDGDNTVSPANRLTTSKFTLPKDWSVKKVPRKFGGPADKYYRDPETGRHFRSLKEVERYLTEGVIPTQSRVKKLNVFYDEKVDRDITEVTPIKTRPKRLKYRHDEKNSGSPDMVDVRDKMLNLEEDKDNQNQLAIVSPTSVSTPSSFKLPEGWVVEEIPRRSGDYVDKYFYEPGTGQKFRSIKAVQKHLTELEDNSPLSVVLEEIKENNLPISKAFKLRSCIKNCGSYNSWKKSLSKKEKTSPPIACPPSKINWVIGGSGENNWNAFEDEILVPDSVKQQWENTFMMAINNTKHTTTPLSG